MKKKYKRILLITGGAAVVLVLFLYSLAPLSVAGIRLSTATYQDVVEEDGSLYALRRWNGFALQDLTVKSVHVRAGDEVKAGDLLLELDDALLSKQWLASQNSVQLQLTALKGEMAAVAVQKQQYAEPQVEKNLQGLKAQIMSIQEHLDYARTQLQNTQELYESDFASKDDLETAGLEVVRLEGDLQEQQSALAVQEQEMNLTYRYYGALETALQEQIGALEEAIQAGESDPNTAQVYYQHRQTRLQAPVNGKVLLVEVRPGELASAAKPLVALYEPGALGAEVYLLAAEAALITPGMAAQVVIKGREKEKTYRQATVASVSAHAEERISALGLAESRVKVELTLIDGRDLIVGQEVGVEFPLQSKEQALAVPKAAVFACEDGYAVMKEEGGRARLQVIEKDFETDTMVIIKSGLAAEEVVLLTPKQEGLKDGSRIAVYFQ